MVIRMKHRFIVIVQMAGLVKHAKFRFGLVAPITIVSETKNIAKALELTRDVLIVVTVMTALDGKYAKRTNARDALAFAELI